MLNRNCDKLTTATAWSMIVVICLFYVSAAASDETAQPRQTGQPATTAKTSAVENSKQGDAQPSGGETEESGGKSGKKAGNTNAKPNAADETPDKPAARSGSQPAPANPLAQWIKSFFRARERSRGNRHKAKEQRDTRSGAGQDAAPARDDIDQRAPHDHQQESLLRKSAGLLQRQNWKQAIELLQYLLERTEDSLVRRTDGTWVSVRWEANRLLATLPPESLKNYQLQYGALAKQLLAEGRRDGDQLKIVEVATKFFHTEAGYEAANLMGTLHFDRGEFGMSARWFARLIEADSSLAEDPRWQLKAAFAFDQAGNHSGRAEIMQQLGSLGDTERLELGGQPIDPDTWLQSVRPNGLPGDPRLEDWPVFFGSSSRTGTAVGGDPLLLPRWTHESVHSHQIREQITALTEDLESDGFAAVPAMFPLMVDGKIIFRTLRGVQVVDAETGRPIWETRDDFSAEQMLIGATNGRPFGSSDRVQARALERFVSPYKGHQASNHPLTGLLFRDGTYGIVSSDGRQNAGETGRRAGETSRRSGGAGRQSGETSRRSGETSRQSGGRRVFVIEDHAVLASHQRGYNWNWRPGRSDPYRRDWASNKLVAYDLDTGRPIWEVGGTVMEEPFDLPLAGNYFLGAPVADGAELFVVGEKDNEIRLYSLEGSSGRPNWSQLIAFSDAKIDRDLGRRWWTSQVAVSDGVLVCPTTVGWLVAVDRINHAVLWVHRYAAPKPSRSRAQRRGRFESYVPRSDLNDGWCPSAPVISGHRVIYAPSEEPLLVCVNLFDGSRVWQKPKGSDALYLAGVFSRRVVVVGESSVTAYALSDGEMLWNLQISADNGRPSGVGVAVGDRYHLPLHSGQLWSIDLGSGEVDSRFYLPQHERPLRNLAMYRGMLLSLDSFGVRSFEQRHSLEEEIRHRQSENPGDAWALLQEAEIRLVERDYSHALSLLRRVAPSGLSGDQAERHRSRMIEALSAVIRSDFSRHEGELDELAEYVRSDREQFAYRRLSSEQLEARGEVRQAFELLLDLSEQLDDRRLTRRDDDRVNVRATAWLSGKLADVWQRIPPEDRPDLETRIVYAKHDVLSGDLAAQERFVTLYGFHPAAIDVERRLAETYAAAGDLLRAENRLLKLSRHVAAEAFVRLARLLDEAGWKADSDHYWQLLEDQFADSRIEADATVKQLVEARLAARSADEFADGSSPASWRAVNLEISQTVSYYSSKKVEELLTGPQEIPFFRSHRFQLNEVAQRLEVIDADNESMHWLLPLRTSARPLQQNQTTALTSGHQLVLLYRDVLHCVSPLERKVLWSQPLDSDIEALPGQRVRSEPVVGSLKTSAGFLSRNSLASQSRNKGLLAIANSDYVCVRGRRQFQVLDAVTGEIRWSCRELPQRTTLFGSEGVVYLLALDRSEASAFRALDGKRLDIPDLAAVLSKAVHVGTNGVVLVEIDSAAARDAAAVVRLYDPIAGTEHWRREFPANTRFALPRTGELIALTTGGELSLLDFEQGRSQTFDVTIPPLSSEHYVLADHRLLYLVANKSRKRRSFSRNELPSLPVNGELYAFDRATHEKLWQQSISSQNLIYRLLNHSPIIVFASRDYRRQDALSYWLLSLAAIDKQTGRRLIDTTLPSNTGLRTLDVNMAERYVELRLHNQRIRLVATDNESAAAE